MSEDATVFVVDDDGAMRDSLALLVRSAGFEAETYASAEAFLKAYDPAKPGCVVLDIRMPGMSGLEAQEALAARDIGIPVIIVSGHADVPAASRAMRAGAVDVLEKPFDSGHLKESIHQAMERDARERRAQARRSECADRFAPLSPREREVMLLLVEGQTVKEIAQVLKLSQNTVQIHRARVLEKAQVDSVPGLIWLAIGAGIRHHGQARERSPKVSEPGGRAAQWSVE